MARRPGFLRALMGRKAKAFVALASSVALVATALGIAPSLAAWTRTEYDNGSVTPLNCSSRSPFTTTSWAQEIAGQVAGEPLDGHLATALGLTTASGTPHSTATGGAGSSGLTYLGSDAWDSDLQAGALDSINLGVGLTFPLNQNTGVEAQFARATTTGVATGASGAITTAAGGLVSLQTPTASTPGVGSVSLDAALSGTVGDKLAGDASELANTTLDIGALGSTTTLDSCTALWEGMTEAASVVRNYVLAKLGLDFTSSVVGSAVTDATNAVTSLGSTLDGLQPIGTTVTNGTISTGLSSAIAGTTSPVALSLAAPTTVTVGLAFNLAPALSVLSSTVTDGPVSVNLSTGDISVDLAGLAGFSSLNSLPANTKLINSTTIAALTADITSAINTAITSTLETAIETTLNSATVTVAVMTDVKLLTIDAATLNIGITGSVGQFLDPVVNGEPTVSISKVDVGGAAGLLSVLGVNLDAVLGPILTNLVAPLEADLIPAIGTGVISPLITTATTDITSAITTLDSTTLPPVLALFGGVTSVLQVALELTVNAEPDVVAGSVGAPETAVTGEYFESALHIGVLDTTDSSSTLGLFLGSSAVGPNTKN